MDQNLSQQLLGKIKQGVVQQQIANTSTQRAQSYTLCKPLVDLALHWLAQAFRHHHLGCHP